jgi:hypothetical protein
MKVNMHILRNQNGMSMVSWILLLGLVIVISIPAVKIIHIYIKSSHIASTLKSIKSDTLFLNNAKNPESIKTKLLNSLAIVNVPEVTPDEITVTNANKYIVRIKHSYREKILNDWYFTLDADESVDIPASN